MAQAPERPSGAPRQNKTVKAFKGMNTRARRSRLPEGAFAWLENIQPIGKGNLRSIAGRSAAVVTIPPLTPAGSFLLETGDFFLLETGDFFLLESA